MACLLNHKADVVFCSFIRVTPTKISILPFKNLREAMVANGGKALVENCLAFNVISTQTLLIQRQVFEELGGFDNSLKRLQDWDLAIRITKSYNAIFLNVTLVNVYEQTDSISLNSDALLESQKKFIEKYRDIYKKYPKIYYKILYRYFKIKFSSIILR